MGNEPIAELPWVTVVCLCYNQADYVETALESVVVQDYPNVELVIVDNASVDRSAKVIEEWIANHEGFPITYLPQSENLGICRGFNLGWQAGKGKYCIDLAADDVLLPERVSFGVRDLEAAGSEYGVHFTDSLEIGPDGAPGHQFFVDATLPQGDVYTQVVARYCIPVPTLMFRRVMLEALGGYDESLHYEDFDIMVRAARDWKFVGHPEVLVYKRDLPRSKGSEREEATSPHLITTAKVCEKIMAMNRVPEEMRALRQRVDYELREAARVGHREAMRALLALSKQLKPRSWQTTLLETWAGWKS